MNRRDALLGLLAIGAAPLTTLGQQEHRLRRIGYVTGASAEANAGWLPAFRSGMSALGWIDGRDYVIDAKYSNGDAQAYAKNAVDMAASKPDLVLVPAEEGARRIAQESKTIPVLVAIAQDPVGTGIAESLRHPGGSITGLTTMARDLGAKRLDLLKEAFPRVTQVAVLYAPDEAAGKTQLKDTEEAAPAMKLSVSPIEFRQGTDVGSAIKRGAAPGTHAYIVTQGFVFITNRQVIVDQIQRLKVPAIFPQSQYADAGGLISYGPSTEDNFRRVATYADKILKGAKPGDLPIEQPIKFELVLNLKTAKKMGFTFPQSILLRADRLIE